MNGFDWLLVTTTTVVAAFALVREIEWRIWRASVRDELRELEWWREIGPTAKAFWSDRVARSLIVWSAIALATWLDRHGPAVTRAEFFGWLTPMLVNVGSALAGAAANVLYRGIEGSIRFLSSMLSWITGQLKSFLVSTGSMFAKVWRSLEGFYKNVIRSALLKLHDLYVRLRAWLTGVFKPLISFLQAVRAKIQEIYKRFVRPLLDALDTIRKVLDVLAKLHVPFAAQLDAYVTKTEQWIVQQYQKLLGDVNKLIDTINGILTLDGYLQRFLFLRTMERDIFFVWRQLVNTRSTPLTPEALTAAGEAGKGKTIATARAEIREYWTSQTGELATDATATALYWRQQFANAAPDDFSDPTA